MNNRFTRNVIGNVSLVAVVIGFLMLTTSGIDLSLVRDGRLTDFACYLFLLALAVLTLVVGRIDYLASRGRISTDKLPAWLQDANDPR